MLQQNINLLKGIWITGINISTKKIITLFKLFINKLNF